MHKIEKPFLNIEVIHLNFDELNFLNRITWTHQKINETVWVKFPSALGCSGTYIGWENADDDDDNSEIYYLRIQ